MSDRVVAEGFSGEFRVTVVAELPGSPEVGPEVIYFPDGDTTGGRDGILLQFSMETREPWIGVFPDGGLSSFDSVIAMPDAKNVLVIRGGLGYLIDVLRRRGEIVDFIPIYSAHLVESRRLVLLTSSTRIRAYDSAGVKWTTTALSYDGITVDAIGSDYVRGTGTAPQVPNLIDFTVDLESGLHTGGAHA